MIRNSINKCYIRYGGRPCELVLEANNEYYLASSYQISKALNSVYSDKNIHVINQNLNVNRIQQNINKIVSLDYDGIGFNLIICPVKEQWVTMVGIENDDGDHPSKIMSGAFMLGETEVTQELFGSVMGFNYSKFKDLPDSAKRPIEQISFYDCLVFCNKLSEALGLEPHYKISDIVYDKSPREKSIVKAKFSESINKKGFRLPQETEWQVAARARGSDEGRYAGAEREDDLPKVAWYDDGNKSAELQTHPVAQKKPNGWGFYDMSGNVRECCYDAFEYEGLPNESTIPVNDCVTRGGGYTSDSKLLTTYERLNWKFGYASNIGLRIAVSLT
jgi:sulfatase modifying factor 1